MIVGTSIGGYWTVSTTDGHMVRVAIGEKADPHTFAPDTARVVANLMLTAADKAEGVSSLNAERELPETVELEACPCNRPNVYITNYFGPVPD